MHYDFTVFVGFSISIAVLIGWIRFKHLDQAYLPFLILITLGLSNEVLSFIVIKMKKSNAINFNVYTLLELVFLNWQFKQWKLFGKKNNWYYIILISSILFWLIENFVWKTINSFNSFFVIYSSYIILLMSITMINRLVLKEQDLLIKNPVFLICIGFLFYFTYAVLVEAFWVTGYADSDVFRTRIYSILVYVNLMANLIYAIAVLWMPTKPKFILPS